MIAVADTSSDAAGVAVGLCVVIFAFAAFIFWFLKTCNSHVAPQPTAAPPDPQEEFREAQRRGEVLRLIPISVPGVMPQKGEEFYVNIPMISRVEERHHTEYRGRSAGVSVRVARGVTLRSGAYGGHPVVHSAMEITDSGALYFSNKRVLFVGAKHSVTVPLSHVVAATDYLDALKIDRENAAPLWFYTGNQNFGLILRRIIAGQLIPPSAPAAAASPASNLPQLLVDLHADADPSRAACGRCGHREGMHVDGTCSACNREAGTCQYRSAAPTS